jgi:hypothetical protein
MKPDLVIGDFAGRVGEPFEVSVDGTQFPIVLAEAVPVLPSARAGGSFSLTFSGPETPWLQQGMYPVRHGSDEWDIFLVPLGPKDGAFLYEAVFN